MQLIYQLHICQVKQWQLFEHKHQQNDSFTDTFIHMGATDVRNNNITPKKATKS